MAQNRRNLLTYRHRTGHAIKGLGFRYSWDVNAFETTKRSGPMLNHKYILLWLTNIYPVTHFVRPFFTHGKEWIFLCKNVIFLDAFLYRFPRQMGIYFITYFVHCLRFFNVVTYDNLMTGRPKEKIWILEMWIKFQLVLNFSLNSQGFGFLLVNATLRIGIPIY